MLFKDGRSAESYCIEVPKGMRGAKSFFKLTRLVFPESGEAKFESLAFAAVKVLGL